MDTKSDPDSGKPIVEHTFEINDENIKKLKEKYSQEMRDDVTNPIKLCMKLVFQAAIEKDPGQRLQLSHDLSSFLTRSDGIVNLFLTLIDFDVSSQKVTTHNQRFLAIANIIARLPKICMPYIEYCRNICNQLKSFLICDNQQYNCLASIIMKSLMESPNSHLIDVDEIIIGPICQPFDATKFESIEITILTYKLGESIRAMRSLMQNFFPANKFLRIFAHSFYCYHALRETPSPLKSSIEVCLLHMINDLEPGPAVCLLDETICHSSYLRKHYKWQAGDYEITLDKNIRVAEDGKFVEDPRDDSRSIRDTVLHVIRRTSSDLVLLEYFFHFQSKVWTASSDDLRLFCASLIEPLLETAIDDSTSKGDDLDLYAAIMKNYNRAIDLISRTLMNYAEFLDGVVERDSLGDAKKLINPSINSCLTLLEVLSVTFGKQKDARNLITTKIIPVLNRVKQAICLHNTWPQDNKLENNLDSVIERLSSLDDQAKRHADINEENDFDSIIKDLDDKLVPVRVHALIRLRQLVMLNDKKALDKTGQLFDLVESTLADEESYVFLSSINLLAEMVFRKTEELWPKLIDLYSRPDLDIDQRLNVGEVLVRVTTRLNKTTPHYARQIMDLLIDKASYFDDNNDDDQSLRVSSLTNIGTLCRNLGDSLGKYILSVLLCIERALDQSSPPEVKRASIELLRTALMGVNRQNIESIQREMGSIYALLKRLRQRTLDEVLVLQVDLALEEISRLAKELLGLASSQRETSQSRDGQMLTKNINLLSLLDSGRS